MAIWQASFDVVPEERLAELFPGWFDAPFSPDYVEILPTDDASELDWWAARQPNADLRAALDRLAPRIRTWSSEVEWWGAEEGDRFDVYSDAGQVTHLYVRFDMRTPNPEFIAGVADLVVRMRCDFIGGGTMLYDGSAIGLAAGLRNSPALRFVKDPIAFLEQVRSTGPFRG